MARILPDGAVSSDFAAPPKSFSDRQLPFRPVEAKMRLALSASTIFLAAFLVFQVQPMIAGYILPWFGGSGAVWTTAMLFFQVVLVAGYAYAHCSITWLAPRTQAGLHVALLAGAIVLLPIAPSPGWKPDGATDPAWQILLLLGANVGLPFLLLASTSPLLQAWIHRAQPGVAPYRLYALGNAASLLALLSYPFVFEPMLTRHARSAFWSWSFALFALASAVCALGTWRRARPESGALVAGIRPARERIGWTPRMLWLLLPATASLLMLAVTHQISQDVAAIPFLWIVPLGLYLFSFVLVFESDRWYRRPVFLGALAPAMAGALWLLYVAGHAPIGLQVAGWSVILLICCTVCHGELARLKPHPDALTGYYLAIAVGGALGGVFAALVAPWALDLFLELHIGLVLCCALAVAAVALDGPPTRRSRRRRFAWAAAGLGGLVLAAGLGFDVHRSGRDVIATARSFHGAMRVSRHGQGTAQEVSALHHGRTAHGLQWRVGARRRWPTLYYGVESGAGLAFRHHDPQRPRRIGAVGLGIGTLAAYGRPGDRFRFYEIDREVVRLARSHFAHLSDSPAEIEVVVGDARVSLERERPQEFDLIFLDAFSSDAIPVHLLTREAFEIYDRHLRHDGILAVHITSAHLDLEPPVRALARHLGMAALRIDSPDDALRGAARASWMLLSRNAASLDHDGIRPAASGFAPAEATSVMQPVWTDDYADVLGALALRAN
ncbi:MAG: fused MFS/spermidine synthase [Deltaproteobacteria bacterium]|nr:fused MFS/spermidine synthase [Deltaproteobacteria bacterium]